MTRSEFSKPLAVSCQCPDCKLPVAQIQGDTLIIKARHHGQPHVSVFSLAEIILLLKANAVQSESQTGA